MLLLTTLLLMVTLCVCAVWSPRSMVILSLWTLSVPYWWNWNFQTSFDTPVGQLNILAIQVFGLCLACLLALAGRSGVPARLTPWTAPHFAFLLFGIVSMAWSPSVSYSLRMLAKLAAPVLFLMVTVRVIGTAPELTAVRRAILGNGMIILGMAILARCMGISSDPNAALTGEAGLGPPGMGPAVFSAHSLPAAMVALGGYLATRKVGPLLIFGVFAAAVLAAHQRTSAAALYLGCAAMMAVGARGLLRFLLPAAGVLGMPLLFIFDESFRRRMFFGDTGADQLIADPSAALSRINGSGRFGLWQEVLDKFYRPHPFVGSGLGATQDFLYGNHGGVGVVHSEYVRLLCEVGLAGLVLFGMLAVNYMVRLVRAVPGSDDKEARGLTLSAIGSLVATLIFMATDNGFDYVSQMGIYVFALIGTSVRVARSPIRIERIDLPVVGLPSRHPNLMA